MKKLLTIIAAFVITTSATVFANNETSAPGIVKSSFERKFGKTINVKWEKVVDVYVGRFTSSDNNYEVYFSDDGEMLGSSRYILKVSLPETISSAVKKQFPGGSITQVLEYTSTAHVTSYYVIVATYKADLVLHATIYGEIDVVKKTKK